MLHSLVSAADCYKLVRGHTAVLSGIWISMPLALVRTAHLPPNVPHFPLSTVPWSIFLFDTVLSLTTASCNACSQGTGARLVLSVSRGAVLLVFLLSFNQTFKGSSTTEAENVCLDISMSAHFLLSPPVFTTHLSDTEEASSRWPGNSRNGLSLLWIIHCSVSCLFVLTSSLERIHLCPPR